MKRRTYRKIRAGQQPEHHHNVYVVLLDPSAGRLRTVRAANPCRCARKANGFMRHGWLEANNLQFSKDRIASVKDLAPGRLDELSALDRQHAEIYRLQPFLAGPDLAQKLRGILSQSGFDTN